MANNTNKGKLPFEDFRQMLRDNHVTQESYPEFARQNGLPENPQQTYGDQFTSDIWSSNSGSSHSSGQMSSGSRNTND